MRILHQYNDYKGGYRIVLTSSGKIKLNDEIPLINLGIIGISKNDFGLVKNVYYETFDKNMKTFFYQIYIEKIKINLNQNVEF